MMKYAFGKSQAVLTVWVLMKISLILLVFPVFHYWAHNRWHFTYKRIVDYIFLTLYIIYLVGLMSFPVSVIIKDEIPPASAVIIMCEQVRLVMKTHAFVRENVPRAKNYKPHQDGEKEDNTPCPDFGKFLYFLFVPTLVYRDNYPRTPCIRWRFVAMNFLQVLACLFYVYYIFERFCVPAFQRFGHERVTPREFLLAVFGCMMPGTLLLFISFFAVLHLWMNAFAEMMRFGDRMFYKDWWNSTSFANYYRTWNVVVHDWLYTYVYKDMHQVMGIKSMAPMFTVFLLSAVIHEYIVTFSFKFFYPVLFVQFGGFGVIFVFLTNKRKAQSWNIFMWLALFVGTGLLMCLYSMEWYARRNCPPVLDSFFDYMIPRSWMCSAFTLK
ncbi:sterol O-acyltransferase 1-like [Limulus polyphemus]|uniref:Sterol O-acyltransferase 1-like n=1 Tax=Limulus polyphemus TaxID=6850 RepID=A0ABM1BPT9_LIMPO|nr:sterol O-acyltransferase 1-like [Limulus polyphemus]XP_022254657.1 sterol O-acyltransferase 1-like [Limulus polyphemus]